MLAQRAENTGNPVGLIRAEEQSGARRRSKDFELSFRQEFGDRRAHVT